LSAQPAKRPLATCDEHEVNTLRAVATRAAVLLRRAFPLPVPLTVPAVVVVVASLALGIGGLWADDGYLTNLLSAVTASPVSSCAAAPRWTT
jgi:hypothetical protein